MYNCVFGFISKCKAYRFHFFVFHYESKNVLISLIIIMLISYVHV